MLPFIKPNTSRTKIAPSLTECLLPAWDCAVPGVLSSSPHGNPGREVLQLVSDVEAQLGEHEPRQRGSCGFELGQSNCRCSAGEHALEKFAHHTQCPLGVFHQSSPMLD